MLIESLESRCLMSVSPCGITINETVNNGVIQFTATQGSTTVGTLQISNGTYSYSYNFAGQTGTGNGTFKL